MKQSRRARPRTRRRVRCGAGPHDGRCRFSGRAPHGLLGRCVDLAVLAPATARALGFSAVAMRRMSPRPRCSTRSGPSIPTPIRRSSRRRRSRPRSPCGNCSKRSGSRASSQPGSPSPSSTPSAPPAAARPTSSAAPAPTLVSAGPRSSRVHMARPGARSRGARRPSAPGGGALPVALAPPRQVDPAAGADLRRDRRAACRSAPCSNSRITTSAIVADVEHLRGRGLYGSADTPPVAAPRKIWIERMRTPRGEVVPERQARVCLGATTPEGDDWAVRRTLSPDGWGPVVMRALLRRPSTVVMQLGLRA
jgi:hypothetical protein